LTKILENESSRSEIEHLKAENARLKALLDAHGIPWRQESVTYTAPQPPAPVARESIPPLTLNEKIALFRSLLRGREDVCPVRRESAKGKFGCSPSVNASVA
jgi:hypothetical protein